MRKRGTRSSAFVGRHGWRTGLPRMRLLGCVRLCLPATVALQRLRPAIQPDERHLVSFEKVASPILPDGDCRLRERCQGTRGLAPEPDLDVQYKTAFVLSHKLREAMGSEVHNPDQPELYGTVEIDGMYAGGNVKPANRKSRAN